MRIVHELIMNVSQDEAGEQVQFKRSEVLSRVTIDTYEKHLSNDFKVLDTASKSLSLGDVTSPAKGLYLEVDADCDVKLNGSGDAIQIRAAPTPTARRKLFLEGNITAIEVTASQATDVNGTYVIWGDAVAP